MIAHLAQLRRPRAPGRRQPDRAGREAHHRLRHVGQPTTWWDNTRRAHLGFVPQDSSEPFRAAVEARQPSLDPTDPDAIYQGGGFVAKGPFE